MEPGVKVDPVFGGIRGVILTVLFAIKLVSCPKIFMKSFGRRTRIDQYSLDGQYLKTWSSIKEAGNSMGFTAQTISNCLRGKCKSAHGYVWKYIIDHDLEDEVWKQYHSTEYAVSNLGRVKMKTGKVSTVSERSCGYKRLRIKQGTIAIHRMVAEMFVANPEKKPFVNHKNGVKSDNRAENLEWVTHRENMIHAEHLHANKHTL